MTAIACLTGPEAMIKSLTICQGLRVRQCQSPLCQHCILHQTSNPAATCYTYVNFKITDMKDQRTCEQCCDVRGRIGGQGSHGRGGLVLLVVATDIMEITKEDVIVKAINAPLPLQKPFE